jgi:hypothetical protein
MIALPTFLPLSEAARKSRQVDAQMVIEAGVQGTEILKMFLGQSRPEEKEGQVNIVGNGSKLFSKLLTTRLGLPALPPEPQDEADAVVASKFPQGIIGRNGEMAEEKAAIQQQIANGGKGHGQTDLGGGGVGMSDQICGIDAATIRGVEIPCAAEPFSQLRGALCKQFQPEVAGDVEVMGQIKTGDVA